MVERFDLRSPSILRQTLEKFGVEVTPWSLCKDRKTLDALYRNFPDLAGDGTAIGPGDDGSCQSWRRNPGWWKEIIRRYS